MQTEELAWAAGLFEGEGSICILKVSKTNTGTLRVEVSNTDLEIIAFFHTRWAGSVTPTHSVGNRRQAWRWCVHSKMAGAFLNEVLPYLRTARYRERALLGLEYQAQKPPSGARPRGSESRDEYRARQEAYAARMKVLNKRGRA